MTELLAPAGNMEALKAAIANGCDAIYLGLQKFGARAYSDNFSADTLKEAVDYAHLRDVKIYVTMNTIVFEDEISDMQEQLRQDELAQQQYKNEQAQQEYQDKLRQQQVSNALAAERLDLSKSQWAAKQEKASRTAEKASADAAAKRGSLTGDTGLKVGKSGVSSGGTVPYSAARMRSQGRSDTAIRTELLKEGYSSSEVRKIMQQLNS